MSDLDVAIVQSFTVWHNPEANLNSIQNQIESINENVDLIVLPEMWLSGFTMKAHQFWSHTQSGIDAMKKWSVDFDAAVIGTLITKVESSYYNRAYVISDGQVIHTYDKKHLFAFSGEERYFKPGGDRCVFEFRGWKICLNICYDLRFPVWTRNYDNYDLLVYCANWPNKRILAWDTLLKARAIENQSFVLGVNCTGIDAWHNNYSGHSTFVNFDGENIDLKKDTAAILIQKLKQKDLHTFRNNFPFLKDQDSFELK